jgi:hypothetical protein
MRAHDTDDAALWISAHDVGAVWRKPLGGS